jgi:hypothetical protein
LAVFHALIVGQSVAVPADALNPGSKESITFARPDGVCRHAYGLQG